MEVGGTKLEWVTMPCWFFSSEIFNWWVFFAHIVYQHVNDCIRVCDWTKWCKEKTSWSNSPRLTDAASRLGQLMYWSQPDLNTFLPPPVISYISRWWWVICQDVKRQLKCKVAASMRKRTPVTWVHSVRWILWRSLCCVSCVRLWVALSCIDDAVEI